MIYLFRQPENGELLCIGADPGEGNDYSAFTVISKKYSDVIMVGKSKEESSQLGHTLNHVGNYLKKLTGQAPPIAPERNTGAATIYVLKSLNYPNIFRMPQSFTNRTDETSDNLGWHTNVSSRPKMLDDLAIALRQHAIKIPSKLIVDELFNFVRNQKTGRPEAEIGCHDDLVFSMAIAWQIYQLVTPPVDYYPPTDSFTKKISNSKNWSFK